MNNLLLLRHSQSLWNKQRRFTGWADIELTKQGRSQAELAGKLIKDLNIEFDAYFTSVQIRAIDTLEIILDDSGCYINGIKKSVYLISHFGKSGMVDQNIRKILNA